jgi:glycosyltransferase involved in cell wall biosynthesis
MKSVCMFAPCAGGGHARYAWELTSALARHPRGGRFELVSCRDLDDEFRAAPYPVHAGLPPLRERGEFRTTLGWAANRLLYYPRRERQFLKWLRTRPDVAAVHLQEWKPWLAAWLIRRIQKTGRKVFYTVHNVLPHRYPRGMPRALMDFWIRRACLRCDGLFVHSERLADELAQFLGILHPPITVIPHGVWTVPDLPPRPALTERLSWKRLLFFGAIRRNKGLDLLLRAADHLRDYRITIAGEPCEGDYFEKEVLPLVRSLRANGAQIDLLDRFIPEHEVPELFDRHSAIVLPYTPQFRAQSGVVFMALAYGLPVVASRAGGLADLLGEYSIGTTFDTGSPRDLAAAVQALHAAPKLDELDRNLAAARKRFTWHAAAGATLAGYAAQREPVAETTDETTSDDCALGTTAAH